MFHHSKKQCVLLSVRMGLKQMPYKVPYDFLSIICLAGHGQWVSIASGKNNKISNVDNLTNSMNSFLFYSILLLALVILTLMIIKFKIAFFFLILSPEKLEV